jgi:hypothetical protein
VIAAVVAALVLPLLTAVPAAGADGERPVKTPRRIPKVDNEIRIDGVLDEEVWDRALVMGVNNEVRPGNNIPAPVETDMLLAYSETHFYVAFRAWDPDPSQIYAHLCDHDRMWNDEWVVVGRASRATPPAGSTVTATRGTASGTQRGRSSTGATASRWPFRSAH